MQNIKKIFTVFALFFACAAVFYALAIPKNTNAEVCPTLSAGTTAQVAGTTGYYLVNKDFKLMYYTDTTIYRTWEADYTYVVLISSDCFDSLGLPSSYPGGVNVRPGTLLIKRKNSSQWYAVEPKNTIARITHAAARALYGSRVTPRVVTDGDFLNFTKRGADINEAKAHPGMLVKYNGETFYVNELNQLRKVTPEGMTANEFQTRFVRTVTANAIAGLQHGPAVLIREPALVDKTQNEAVDPPAPTPDPEPTPIPTPTPTPTPDPGDDNSVSTGAVYYAGPNGSNSNPGTRDLPFASPAYVTRNVMHGGDTLIILPGRYSEKTYDIDIMSPPSGSSASWTIIKGEDPANKPVIAGSGNLLSMIDMSGKSYVKLENIEITNDNGAQVREGINGIYGASNNLIFKNLYIHHVDQFCVDMRDINGLKILNSKFTYCGFGAVGGPAATNSTTGFRNVLIKNTELSYSGRYYQGVANNTNNPYDRPDGFGIEPSAGPIELDHVIAEGNRGDGLDSKAANTYIHHSIVRNNRGDGVKMWRENSKLENSLIYGFGLEDDGVTASGSWSGIVIDSVQKPDAYFEITNVTVHGSSYHANYPMYVQYNQTVPVRVLMRNSIFDGDGGPVYFGNAVNVTLLNNLFRRANSTSTTAQVYANGTNYTGSQLEGGAFGVGNKSQDPKFVSPVHTSSANFHLQIGSPAIDAGGQVPLTSDLDGNVRPIGAGFDMGAYER